MNIEKETISLKRGFFLSETDYFSYPAISSSGLSSLISEVSKTPVPIKASPKALHFGSALHQSITGVGDFEQNILKDFEPFAQAFWENEMIQHIFKNRRWVVEQGIALRRKGYLCKIKPDFFSKSGVLIDLKSTSEASQAGFEKAITNYEYIRQMGFYASCLQVATGVFPKEIWILGVCKSIPKRTGKVKIFPFFVPQNLLRQEIGKINTLLDYARELTCRKTQKIPAIPQTKLC